MVKRKRQRFFGKLCYNHLLDAEQAANAIPFADGVALIKSVYGLTLQTPMRRARKLSAFCGSYRMKQVYSPRNVKVSSSALFISVLSSISQLYMRLSKRKTVGMT